MNLYTSARKYVDLKRLRRLSEEKIKNKEIAEAQKQQEMILAELEQIEMETSSKFCNWRSELEEGMTTAGMGMRLFSGEGDTDLETVTQDAQAVTDGSGGTGGTYSYGDYHGTVAGGAAAAGFVLFLDTSKYDTIKFNISGGNSTETSLRFGETPNTTEISTSNGENTITIPSNRSGSKVMLLFTAQKSGADGLPSEATITDIKFQRRSPLNVIVGLDDPEANNFVRTNPHLRGLSAEQREKKLLEMLEAGDEYLLKHLGMISSSARPSETVLQQSFMDIHAGGETLPPPKNNTEKLADKYGLPRDYKDRLVRANAYFHNNVDKLPPMNMGLGPMNMGLYSSLPRGDASGVSDLMRKAYQRQGFTRDQIDTIEKNNLLQTFSYTKKSEPKTNSRNQWDDPDRYRNIVNVDPQTFWKLYNRKFGNTSQPSSQNTSRSNSYSNIRVGNTNNTNTSNVKDYGNIASHDKPFSKYPAAGGSDRWPGIPADKMDILYPSNKPTLNVPIRSFGIKQASGGKDYGNVASADWPSIKTHSTLDDIIKAPLPSRRFDQFGREINPKTGLPLKKVQRNQKTQVAHHEPEGEIIVEKKLKSPKDIASKIPGYYDGKPAPLGFPMDEPPKMVNGFHPDLVDGKKVANRFNKMDPISARSMPATGNPHIDKKVEAARKKKK